MLNNVKWSFPFSLKRKNQIKLCIDECTTVSYTGVNQFHEDNSFWHFVHVMSFFVPPLNRCPQVRTLCIFHSEKHLPLARLFFKTECRITRRLEKGGHSSFFGGHVFRPSGISLKYENIRLFHCCLLQWHKHRCHGSRNSSTLAGCSHSYST